MRQPAGELPLARELASAVAQRGAVGMLQRDPAPGPLTPAQVTKAIGYYKSQPQAYSVVIMLQIQEAVGVEPTGIVDAQTVQAVAVWQRDNGGTPPEQKLPGVVPPPPLAIDGMAGPRTLPRLFAHGLNVKSEGLAFGKASQTGVIDKWHELTAQAARGEARRARQRPSQEGRGAAGHPGARREDQQLRVRSRSRPGR